MAMCLCVSVDLEFHIPYLRYVIARVNFLGRGPVILQAQFIKIDHVNLCPKVIC